MKQRVVRAGFPVVVALVLITGSTIAQKKEKPWIEWSKKDAEKVLTDSPWAKVQTDTDTSQMFYSPTSDPRMSGVRNTSTTDRRTAEGAVNSAVNVKFQVRFFSARPIRQALARLMMAQHPPDEVVQKLRNFADLQSPNSIIVTVTFDSPDQRYTGQVQQAFASAITETLRNNTYLQRPDGKQQFLEEYVPPG